MQRPSRRRVFLGLLTISTIGSIVAIAAGPAEPNARLDGSLSMSANISSRTLTVRRGGEVINSYSVAVGSRKYPTPRGSYTVQKIVWNPAWIPPDSKWAEDKRPTGPGDPDNPMKVVKIFFREPAYFIHGTAATGSLGEAASHGCIRMDPDQAGELALLLMDNAGIERDWDWVRGLLHMGESRTVHLRVPVSLSVHD
jgi:murein L,D-transpeptidase YcbB/YkuD